MHTNLYTTNAPARRQGNLAGKKILFANFLSDGHFNLLTGLAIHLKELGCDIRWYTSKTYTGKLKKLQIPHDPFKCALEVSNNDFDSTFPGRTKCRTMLGRLKFDMINAFILRAPEYYADIADIYKEFPFELLVADAGFTAIPLVRKSWACPLYPLAYSRLL